MDEELLSAAYSGDVKKIRELVAKGADIEAKNSGGYTPLGNAAFFGKVVAIRAVVELSADLEAKDNTPLASAAYKGHVDAIRVLVELGADLEAKNNFRETPLVLAAGNDHVDAVRALIELGANKEAKSFLGKSLMEVAKNDATRAALQGLPAPAPSPTPAPPRISPKEAAALRQQRIEAQQRRNQPAAVTPTPPPVDTVPADLAQLLRELSLSAHGANLVDKLGVTSVSDLKYITDDMISKELPTMKPVERAKLLAATQTGGSANTVVQSHVAAPAPAPRLRVRALVIGIDSYSSPVPGKLGNAISDASTIHEALCKLPGAHSTLLTDCSKATFEAALKDFRDGTGTCDGRGMRVTAAPKGHDETTPALFFFAGHGIQVSGRNYLVPADFAMPHRSDKLEPMLRDTERACVSLSLIEEYMEEAEVTAAALWLDCCRNVPDFLADWAQSAPQEARAPCLLAWAPSRRGCRT